MKRSVASSLTMLAISLLLVGCSTNKSDQKKDTSSKNAKSEKIASSKKAASESKAKESSKRESLKKESSRNKASSESLAKEKTKIERETNGSSTNQSQKSYSSSQSSNSPDFSLDIHSFVNKYGMSEAAYRSEYMGMNSKEALYATPDSHETSGELQSENMYRNGKDPYASNSDNDYADDGGIPDQDDSYYTQKFWEEHPKEAAEAESQAAANGYDNEDYDSYDEDDY